MSAGFCTIKGVVMEHTRINLEDRPDLQDVVRDVLALRKMTKLDNFMTHKTQRAILSYLTPLELVAVARALEEAEVKQRPIVTRPNSI